MKVPAVLMRGGTSKALFFHDGDLPTDPRSREEVILSAFGSPDRSRRQIDGIGGGTAETSKVAIVSAAQSPEVDVTFEFGQVLLDEPRISWDGTCGNISSAVAPFAIDEGLVDTTSGSSTVRFLNINTGAVVESECLVNSEGFDPVGDYTISGVPGAGSPVRLTFYDPGGATTGSLFPTGSTRDRVAVPGLGDIEVTVIDSTNLFIFTSHSNINLSNPALPEGQTIWDRTEHIRRTVAVETGLAPTKKAVASNVPKISFVYPQSTAVAEGGGSQPTVVVAEMASVGDMHPSYAFTGAVATATACSIPGTIAQKATRTGSRTVEIRHPSGSIDMAVALGSSNCTEPVVESVTGFRTARRLMSGFAHI